MAAVLSSTCLATRRGRNALFTRLSDAYAVFAVAAVPEPATSATMLVGFCGLGFMAYRRKRRPNFNTEVFLDRGVFDRNRDGDDELGMGASRRANIWLLTPDIGYAYDKGRHDLIAAPRPLMRFFATFALGSALHAMSTSTNRSSRPS